MSAYKSDFLRVLSERGFIHQVSEPEALDALAKSSCVTAYIGFDCTAPSLHIGHLLIHGMLAFESVKMRIECGQERSFLEFNYMILQAYDCVEFNKREGCVLQMGGSDQWGNIVIAIDLGRRMRKAQHFALTAPL